MKINKFIAKGLSIGLLLNSLSILSYASIEIPNRYQILEGEYITIDDSMEGNLEEIEIFGNTVQDENNLEDIQSVGDLYIDENGNPILDKQGRKQYKIDIISIGKNLLNENRFMSGWGGNKPWFIELGMSDNIITDYIPIKKNTDYVINKCFSYLWLYDETKNLIKEKINLRPGESFNTEDATYLILGRSIASININQSVYKGVQLEEGNIRTEFQNYKEERESILLPTQLQKVGNVKDKLYWDSNKHKYIIEKRISKKYIQPNMLIPDYRIKDLNNGFIEVSIDVYSIGFDDYSINGDDVWAKPISNNFLGSDYYNNGSINENAVWFYSSYIVFKINKLDLDNCTSDGINNWFKNNQTWIKYVIKPNHIETNITSKLKIPTYNDKTHIYIDSESGINPTLKVTVDRLPQIAKEAVAQAESDSTNYNISLARRYINMLPESSYKEQLQNQLNEIFSSDMLLDRKLTTSNLDVYIKSENILQMSLDTNSISFDDFSGIEDVVKENAVNITINSSLPYQINAYLPAEIQNSDKSATMDKSILNIKESGESNYQTFVNTTDKIVLKDNCSAGNYLTHGVDLKLAGGIAHEKDVYKATIKLEAEQK